MSSEAEDIEWRERIMAFLKENGTVTTDEVESHLKGFRKDEGPNCHDTAVHNLSWLKRNKMITGVMNKEKHTWEWSYIKPQ